MKFLCPIVLLFSLSLNAQYKVKIKREDNRFLFFQLGTKSDTLIKNQSDLFLIKLPDSLKNEIRIFITNGQFVKSSNDSLFLLRFVPGMKYSHSQQESIFETLVEGNCSPSKLISIEFLNTRTRQQILQNNFIVK